MTRFDSALGARRPVQLAAMVVGVVFLLIGIAGFIPGITTNYDQLQFAGHPTVGTAHLLAATGAVPTSEGESSFVLEEGVRCVAASWPTPPSAS